MYFTDRTDKEDQWKAAVESEMEKLVGEWPSPSASFEALYSSVYNLILFGHAQTAADLVTKWASTVARKHNGPFQEENRNDVIKCINHVFGYYNKWSKTSTAKVFGDAAEARSQELRRKWRVLLVVTGRSICWGKRATERMFAPGGQEALKAAKSFAATAEEASTKDNKRKREAEENNETTLDNWHFEKIARSPYAAPEMPKLHVLCGTVKNHKRKADGTEVQTSAVKRVKGGPDECYAVTYSGSTYRLLTPKEDYVLFMEREGKPLYHPEGRDLM